MLNTDASTITVVPQEQRNLKTVAQAAREIGRDRATIFRWIDRKWLTRYYISLGRRRTAVDMDELKALLENPPGEAAPDEESHPRTDA